MQGVYFVETALETHGNRSHRWLKDLLDCVIADPSTVVSWPLKQLESSSLSTTAKTKMLQWS
jgi:hypothetical protein